MMASKDTAKMKAKPSKNIQYFVPLLTPTNPPLIKKKSFVIFLEKFSTFKKVEQQNLAIWWHFPGRSISSAVKVDNVPVRGKPGALTSDRWKRFNINYCEIQIWKLTMGTKVTNLQSSDR